MSDLTVVKCRRPCAVWFLMGAWLTAVAVGCGGAAGQPGGAAEANQGPPAQVAAGERLAASAGLPSGSPQAAQTPATRPEAPKPKPEEPPEPPRPPAHVVEATDVLDLSKLPWPPGTDGANDCPTQVSYRGPGDFAEVGRFYQDWLKSAGWTDVTTSGQAPGTLSKEYKKAGFRVRLSVNKDETGVMVNVGHTGNFDSRWLPKPADSQDIGVNFFASTWFVSPMSVKELASFCAERLAADGWRLIDRNEQPDDVMLDFIQNGVKASARVCKSPRYPGKSMVQYGVSMARDELPVPPDAEGLKFDDYGDVSLSLSTKQDVPATVDFVEKAMKALRWEPVAEGRQATDKGARLRFRRGRQFATVKLAAADGATRMEIATLSAPSKEVFEAAKREEARAKARDEQAKRDAMEALKDAVPVADFPLPDGAREIQRSPFGSAQGGSIRYNTATGAAENVAFFREKLSANGWQENKSETQLQESFGQLVLEKGKARIRIVVYQGPDKDKGRQVMIEGTGLVAEKDSRKE